MSDVLNTLDKYILKHTIAQLDSYVFNANIHILSSKKPTYKQLYLLKLGTTHIYKPKNTHRMIDDSNDHINSVNILCNSLDRQLQTKLKYIDHNTPVPKLYVRGPQYEIPNPNLDIHNFCKQVKIQITKKLDNINNIKHKHNSNYLPNDKLREYLRGLRELCTDDTIRVLKADKNLGWVVLDRHIYDREVNRHLNDRNTYEMISLDTYQQDMKTYLTRQDSLLKEYKEYLDDTVKEYLKRILKNKTYTIPTFKVLAKIHKLKDFHNLDELRFRNIIPNFNSFTMPLSKVIDYLISEYLENTHILKDTLTLVKQIHQLEIPSNSTLISMDFESLFTNIPIEDSINTIRIFLLESGVDINIINFICDSAQLVFNNNIFISEDNRYFRQIRGLAMGSQTVPKWANLYLYQKEKEYISKCGQMIYFTRLIDDGFGVIKGGEQIAMNFINGYKELFDIAITYEHSFYSLVMLDVVVSKGDHGESLDVRTYTKPTNKHLFITSKSFHPKHTLKGLIYGQLRRFIITNSKQVWYEEERRNFLEHLRNRGYKYKLLYPIFNKIKYSERNNILFSNNNNNNNNEKQILSIVHVYNTQLTNDIGFGGILHNEWQNATLDDRIRERFQTPMISFKRTANVSDLVNKHYKNANRPQP